MGAHRGSFQKAGNSDGGGGGLRRNYHLQLDLLAGAGALLNISAGDRDKTNNVLARKVFGVCVCVYVCVCLSGHELALRRYRFIFNKHSHHKKK